MSLYDPFHARDTFDTGSGTAGIYRLSRLEDAKLTSVARLPYSIRILLESVLRNCDGYAVTERDVANLAGWNATAAAAIEVPFKPARVILQDFTGVPCVVDLAAMRSAMQRLGGDPKKINPLVPVDLVIDHSVQVDFFGGQDSMDRNVAIEFQRNRERYEFLRWGQKAFQNFRVVPPAVGIVHQVNLEYLAKGVFLGKDDAGPVAFPDSLVGTDSHTTMINGLGVLGWGVGGIEAEAVMLGQPLYMLAPEVIGFELSGELPPGTTATDLVLTITQILRKEGVVNKFVEYFGPAIKGMKVADRALVANMAPEYGATMGFFPIDEQTLSLPPPHRPQRRRGRAGRALHEGTTTVLQQPVRLRSRSTPRCSSSTSARSSLRWPGRSGRRTACRWPTSSRRSGSRCKPRSKSAASDWASKIWPARQPSPTTAAVPPSATAPWSSPPSPVARTRATRTSCLPPACSRRRPSSAGFPSSPT